MQNDQNMSLVKLPYIEHFANKSSWSHGKWHIPLFLVQYSTHYNNLFLEAITLFFRIYAPSLHMLLKTLNPICKFDIAKTCCSIGVCAKETTALSLCVSDISAMLITP